MHTHLSRSYLNAFMRRVSHAQLDAHERYRSVHIGWKREQTSLSLQNSRELQSKFYLQPELRSRKIGLLRSFSSFLLSLLKLNDHSMRSNDHSKHAKVGGEGGGTATYGDISAIDKHRLTANTTNNPRVIISDPVLFCIIFHDKIILLS